MEGGVVYALAPQASLRVNYAQGFKYPDLRALSADTRTPRGDWMLGADVIREGIKDEAHALAPEQSENVELGVRGHLGTRQRSACVTISAASTRRSRIASPGSGKRTSTAPSAISAPHGPAAWRPRWRPTGRRVWAPT